MKNFLRSYFKISVIVLMCSVILISCKDDKSADQSLEGQEVKSIQNDVVKFVSGAELDLANDSFPKVYFLIRHAEKDTTSEELNLSEAGTERSYKLADMFRQTRLDAVYTTLFSRSIQTVDSLTQMKAMPFQPYLNQNMKERFTEMLNRPEEGRVLIVGHSNTVPAIVNFLAEKEIYNRTFEDDEYDNFIVLMRNKSGASIVYKLKY